MLFSVKRMDRWNAVLDRCGLGYRSHAVWLDQVRGVIRPTLPDWSERLPVCWRAVADWDPVKQVTYVTWMVAFGFHERRRRPQTIDVGGVRRLLDVRFDLYRLGVPTGVVVEGPPFPSANTLPHAPGRLGDSGGSHGRDAKRVRFRGRA